MLTRILNYLFSRKLPPGYEIRSVDTTGSADGEYVKVVPYYKGKPISEGKYAGIYGYSSVTRTAWRAITVHYRNGMDKNR